MEEERESLLLTTTTRLRYPNRSLSPILVCVLILENGEMRALKTNKNHRTMVQNKVEIETLNYTLSHELGSEQSERASKRMSAAERASEASRAEQAKE